MEITKQNNIKVTFKPVDGFGICIFVAFCFVFVMID